MSYRSLSPEALVLACAQTGDAAAWEEFVRRFHRLIATVVLRTARRWGALSFAAVDDLVQDTYLKLCADQCRLLRCFEAHQPDAFYGYLKVVTANLVHDHFKAAYSKKRGAGDIQTTADPWAATNEGPAITNSQEASDHRVFMREVDACLRSLESSPHTDRDRKIFWLFYRVGLTAKDIASLPSVGLSTKGVESKLRRLTRAVREKLVASHQLGHAAEGQAEGVRSLESL